jgi:cytoskeletal protein RodZ
MIGYLVMGNLNSLIYFLIVGLITSIFTQNMCIILLSALLLSNILIAGQNSYTEGFTDPKTSSQDTKTTMATTMTNKPKTTDTVKTNTPKTNKPMTNTSNVGKLATPINDGPMEESTDTTKNTVSETKTTTDEAFEVGMENSNKKNYRVDYASTIEDAYGQLNQILGSDGIKRLTDDTQNLLKQQIQLADAMKSMGPLISNMAPLIEQTKGLMNGVGGFDIKDLGSFASLAKGFSSSSNTP